uniref:Copper transport protein n=1 Tax=Anthurium amnicola TaxID=1678845 RepID=A0A1D1YPP5_9ARAE
MDMGGMGMGGMDMGGGHKMSYTHMTFFWGRKSEILFKGWPGDRGGFYALALVVVFLLGLLVEWLSHCRLITTRGARWPRLAAGLLRAALHTLRVGLAYLLMLAVMSFNVGVLVVAIAGHAVGFLLFSGALFGKSEATPGCDDHADLPPMKC